MSGRSPVPSEKLAPCYKENCNNAPFLTTDSPDFTDESRGRRPDCFTQMQAARLPLPLHYFSASSSRAGCCGFEDETPISRIYTN